jgi:hypothetical protein
MSVFNKTKSLLLSAYGYIRIAVEFVIFEMPLFLMWPFVWLLKLSNPRLETMRQSEDKLMSILSGVIFFPLVWLAEKIFRYKEKQNVVIMSIVVLFWSLLLYLYISVG